MHHILVHNRLQNNLSIYKKSLADDLKLLEKAINTEVVETKVEEVDYSNFPTVLWAIIAKDAENLLPLYLECILEQSYPKEKIFLHNYLNLN